MKKMPLMRRMKTIHFIGIGGSGMSGIAEVLLNQGYNITGSDKNSNNVTSRLTALGAKIFNTHSAQNIVGADSIVVSSAIDNTNTELQAARKAQLPILPRAQMLAELMRFHYGIAIAGTHGKTTTTSLVATILAAAQLDPTFVIGGILNSTSVSARLGTGNYFVVEADESDASFLYFNPMASIVTNIDQDHLQTYGNDFGRLQQAFLDFLHRLPFYGLAVINLDNPVLRQLLPHISRPVITYGSSHDADVQIYNFIQTELSCDFKIHWKNQCDHTPIHLNLPGKHNAANATAAAIIARECCNVAPKIINLALSQFGGVGRRMQNYGEITMPQGKITLIDDYGHHPQEVLVTIQTLRAAWPNRRIVLAFQPHRYTRTQAFFEDFSTILANADALLLMEIYPASETSIDGINSHTLARNIKQHGKIEPLLVADNEELIHILPNVLHDNDILLIQGAGNIGNVAQHIHAKYRS